MYFIAGFNEKIPYERRQILNKMFCAEKRAQISFLK
jgi:hypothetical protein